MFETTGPPMHEAECHKSRTSNDTTPSTEAKKLDKSALACLKVILQSENNK